MERRKLGQLDLNLLLTFHEVARLGSVSAAARSLLRTQPAISARLKQLEEQLGVSLFERAGRRLQLSAIGRALLEDVDVVMNQLAKLGDRVRGVDEEPAGVLRVGALPTLCAYLLPAAVVALTRAYPRVRVELSPGFIPTHAARLRDGELDVVVSVGSIQDGHLRADVIGHVDACAVIRAADARTPRSRLRRDPIDVGALAGRGLVSYGATDDPFFAAVWSWVQAAELASAVRVQVPHIQALKQLVIEAGAWSIVPRYTVVEPELATRRIRGLDIRLPLCVATRRRGSDVPAVRAFVESLSKSTRRERAPSSRS